MININNNTLKKAYVFKQWSRKSYAVFNSLNGCVVIGNLKFDVHGYFYKKKTIVINKLIKIIELLYILKKKQELSVCLNKVSKSAEKESFINKLQT